MHLHNIYPASVLGVFSVEDTALGAVEIQGRAERSSRCSQ